MQAYTRGDQSRETSVSYNNIWPIIEDFNGDVWIGTDGGGLNRLLVESGEFIHYRADGRPGSLSSDYVFSLYIDSSQTLWVGTAGGGLNRFDRQTGSFSAFLHDPADPQSISNNSVRAILEDIRGDFWVGTTDGLNHMDRNEGTFSRLYHLSDDQNSLSHSRVHRIIEDAGGILWIGTRDGLNRYIDPRFTSIGVQGDPADIPRRNDLRSIAVAEEGYYLGSFSGLFLVTPGNPPGQETILASGIVYALDRVSRTLLYAGTQSELLEISGEPGNRRSVRLAEAQVNQLYRDSDDTLWIATEGSGLGYLPSGEDEPRWLRSSDPSLTRLAGDTLLSITEYDERHLLLGIADKNPQLLDRLTLSLIASPWPDELRSVNTATRDAMGNWWLSSERDGLFMAYDDGLRRIGEADGLPSSVIRALAADPDGSVWISSIRGIARLRQSSQQGGFSIEVFRREDGLPGMIFNPGSVAYGYDGRPVFGSTEGLAMLIKADEPSALPAPSAFPLGIEVYEDLQRRVQLYRPGEILELDSANRLLHIRLTAFDYRHPGETEYAYRFSDQSEWIEIGSNGEILLSHIQPGRYRMHVRASGNGGIPLTPERSLDIRVSPPLVLQWPLLLMYATALALLVALYIRLRSRRHLRIIREQEQVVARRTAELTEAKEALEQAIRRKSTFFINLAHETKTPLTFIQNYLDRYLARHPGEQELLLVKDNVDKLVRDMVNYLDAEKIQRSSDLYDHSRLTDIHALLGPKLTMLSEVAQKHQLTLGMELENDLIVCADPLAVDRVVNNLIDNAIKYNRPGGSVRILAKRISQRIHFSVQDSGPGIQKDKLESLSDPFFQLSHNKRQIQGIGMGLFIVRKIAEGLGGKLVIESTPGEGSRFAVDFPAADRHTGSAESSRTSRDIKQSGTPASGAVDRPGSGAESESYYNFRQPPPQKPNDVLRGGEFKHILFIDDDRDMLQLMAESFAGRYDLSFATSAEELLDGLDERTAPDIIVSDIMMDGISGHELLTRLQDTGWRAVPFIFLSARSDKEEYLRSFYEGAVDFIPKPFALEDLAGRIDARISGQERRRRMLMESVQQRIAESLKPLRTSKGIQQEQKRKREQQMSRIDLSTREREILLGILEGKLSKEIASDLDISVRTVEKHVYNLYRKAGVQNRVELINFFHEE